MKIHDFPGFPNPMRVRMAAAEKGLTDRITFVLVDVSAGEHRKAAFKALNPTGTVPALELDDGTVIAECTAITEYLDSMVGERTLTGQSGRERATIHMMQRRAEAGLLDAVATYFHHATEGLGPEIETYQCAEWGRHQRDQAVAGMRYLDGVLADQPFLAGNSFSMADITAYAGLGFADFAGIEIATELNNLLDWRKRVSERPSAAA